METVVRGNSVPEEIIEVREGDSVASAAALDDTVCPSPANVEEADVTTVDTMTRAVLIISSPLSNLSKSISPVGRNRVHHSAMRRPRSTIRCFRMKRTTKKKK